MIYICKKENCILCTGSATACSLTDPDIPPHSHLIGGGVSTSPLLRSTNNTNGGNNNLFSNDSMSMGSPFSVFDWGSKATIHRARICAAFRLNTAENTLNVYDLQSLHMPTQRSQQVHQRVGCETSQLQ